MRNRWRVNPVGVALALTLTLVAAVAAPAGWVGPARAQQTDFAVDIQPQAGSPGTLVTVFGRGAPPYATVRVLWAGYPATLDCRAGRGAEVVATVTADAGGRFTAQHRARRTADEQVGITYLADLPRAAGPATLSNRECFALEAAPVFAETGYRVSDAFWAYFDDGGGVDTFGYPVSEELTLMGCAAQLFQRHVLQRCAGGPVRPMNLLDPDLMPVERVNGSVFPAHDPVVAAAAPAPGAPGYGEAALDHLLAVVPRTFEGLPVDFFSVFVATAPDAPVSPALTVLRNLELWGFPTSRPTFDPTNRDFVYQRFQRGIMHYSRTDEATRGVLLGDWLKAVVTGQRLPADLEAAMSHSPLLRQYCPGNPRSLCRPEALPLTDLTGAFRPAA